ncbi:Malonyl-[acyl-carrier protein] O-methyltransferase [Altererythrobacter insulae]|nr:Malonyl-[acyl-carrier protein] O-methyltransferase [Altererythrobacter insulae]
MNTVLSNNQGQLIEQQCQDIILEYNNVIHLARELKGLGANHLAQKQNRGLSGKAKWFNMAEHYKNYLAPNGTYPATYCLFSGVVVKSVD